MEVESGRQRGREPSLLPPQPDEVLVGELFDRLSLVVGSATFDARKNLGREFVDEYEQARLTADQVAHIWREGKYAPRPVDLFEGLVRFAVPDEANMPLAVWLFARVVTDKGGLHGSMSHRYRLRNEVDKRREEQAQEARIREILQ